MEDDDFDVDEELIIDEADRRRLAGMSELQREMELAERAQKQQEERQRREVLKAIERREGRKAEFEDEEDRQREEAERRASRRSGREVREEAAKRSAMEELRAARQRKTAGGSTGIYMQRSAVDDDEDDDREERMGYEGEDFDLEEEEAMEEEEGEEDGEVVGMRDLEHDWRRRGSGVWHPRDDEMDAAAAEEADYEEVKGIQVRRHKLEEWFEKPFFDTTLPGSMVRLAAGDRTDADGRIVPQYFIAQIVSVEERPAGAHKYMPVPGAPGWKTPYPFGTQGAKTFKWLRVVRGRSDRYWPMAQVSNSSMTEEEFEKWQRVCESEDRPQLTRGETEEIRKKLVAADNYVYTSEDVAKMIEEKRARGLAPRNLALEKARLERERDVAREAGDLDRARMLEEEIKELERARDRSDVGRKEGLSTGAKRGKIADINKRPAATQAVVNVTLKSSIAGTSGSKSKGGGDKAADATLDPFSRRITRPMVYWNTAGASQAEPNAAAVTGSDGGVDEGGGYGTAEEKGLGRESEVMQSETHEENDTDHHRHHHHHQPTTTMIDLSTMDLSVLNRPPEISPLVRKLLGCGAAATTSDSKLRGNGLEEGRDAMKMDGGGGGGRTVTWSEYQQRIKGGYY